MPSDKTLSSKNRKDVRERAFVVHPVLSRAQQGGASSALRSDEEKVEEICNLTEAISLEISGVELARTPKIQAGTFLGKGTRERIAQRLEDDPPDIVIFNDELSPVQQRNLEREWNIKVIDRTGLILEIFGARAQTREGRLQVELAALEYQKSRLVRSWTHLERQRGGAGFMGGPGETQIEIDRRLIGERILRLKKSLEDVKRTRDLSRENRLKVPFPVVALVGYTNAGKSTLFNTLTRAEVFAENLLFATLDPTMRRLELPGGRPVILSDTVGFISDLPTHLIAAFRATLEQILYADIILHVIDGSRTDYDAQRADVIQILEDLGIEYAQDRRIIEVYNKVDLMAADQYEEISRTVQFSKSSCMISAVQGSGLDVLLTQVQQNLDRSRISVNIDLRHSAGKALSWLYDHAQVLERQDSPAYVTLRVLIDSADHDKFRSRFGSDVLAG